MLTVNRQRGAWLHEKLCTVYIEPMGGQWQARLVHKGPWIEGDKATITRSCGGMRARWTTNGKAAEELVESFILQLRARTLQAALDEAVKWAVGLQEKVEPVIVYGDVEFTPTSDDMFRLAQVGCDFAGAKLVFEASKHVSRVIHQVIGGGIIFKVKLADPGADLMKTLQDLANLLP